MNNFLIGVNWLGEYSHGFEELPPGGNTTYVEERATNISLVPDRDQEAARFYLAHVCIL